jgi:hypothetical protein
MQLELDNQEAEVLSTALKYRLGALAMELARTEKHSAQHELAQLMASLETIAQRLEAIRS